MNNNRNPDLVGRSVQQVVPDGYKTALQKIDADICIQEIHLKYFPRCIRSGAVTDRSLKTIVIYRSQKIFEIGAVTGLKGLVYLFPDPFGNGDVLCLRGMFYFSSVSLSIYNETGFNNET